MRKSRRVEGGSVYSIHVLFVNHSTGKKGHSARLQPVHPVRKKRGLLGGGGRVEGNSICAYMYGDNELDRVGC